MTLDPLAAIVAELNAPWRAQAACHGQSSLMFDGHQERSAKRVCKTCPVRVDCLTAALERAEPEGIWGGFNPTERQKIAGPARTMSQIVSWIRSSDRQAC